MRVNAFQPTQAEIGDPMAAAARARAFRQRMYAPKPEPKVEKPIKVIAVKPFTPAAVPKPARSDVLFIGELIIVNGKETTFNPAYMPPGGSWFAEEILRQPDAKSFMQIADARKIIQAVAAEYGVTFAEIVSPRRSRQLVAARQEAVWRVKKQTLLSFPMMGRLFRRDHSTCYTSYQAVEKRKSCAALCAESVG